MSMARVIKRYPFSTPNKLLGSTFDVLHAVVTEMEGFRNPAIQSIVVQTTVPSWGILALCSEKFKLELRINFKGKKPSVDTYEDILKALAHEFGAYTQNPKFLNALDNHNITFPYATLEPHHTAQAESLHEKAVKILLNF